MNKIINKIICLLKHRYKKNQKEPSTVYRCARCGKFKSGPAIDEDGNEVFVFPDGSCIVAYKEKK